jgi:hypothetical protein
VTAPAFEYADLLADGGHFAEPYPDDLDWSAPEGLGEWEDQVHHRFVFHADDAFEYLYYGVSNNHVESEVWCGTYRLAGDVVHFRRTQVWSWVSGKWMDEQVPPAKFDSVVETFAVSLTRDAVGLRFDLDECTFRPLRDCPAVEPMHDDVCLRIQECLSRVRTHLGM